MQKTQLEKVCVFDTSEEQPAKPKPRQINEQRYNNIENSTSAVSRQINFIQQCAS
jgi:hypothetical protein